MRPRIQVTALGMGASVQDLGRTGWLRYGVPMGGAMDRTAYLQANQLLGNAPNAPCIEFLHVGACVLIEAAGWFALAGAADGEQLAPGTAQYLAKGSQLRLQPYRQGLWTYLAAPGGFEAPRWFGSAATDPRCTLGQKIACSQTFTAVLAQPACSTERVARRRMSQASSLKRDPLLILSVMRGPQWHRFDEAVRKQFTAATWRVSSRSDRCGYRLEGPVLKGPVSMLSEPVLPGSFQIPGNGQPIVTMVDGPTVGGYPKLAILSEADRCRLAQCAPGTEVRFRWSD